MVSLFNVRFKYDGIRVCRARVVLSWSITMLSLPLRAIPDHILLALRGKVKTISFAVDPRYAAFVAGGILVCVSMILFSIHSPPFPPFPQPATA
mgnify:CR=1 FL=1